MTELKPCPFCGNKQPRILTFAEHYRLPMYRGQRAIECSCGAFVRGAGNEAAIAAWNRRADNELPEHGDLIEKQTALAALYSDYAYAAMDIIEKEVPIVIPSNKEDAG